MCHTYLEHVQIVDSLPLASGCDDELKRLREENALQDQIIKDLEHMITVNSAGEAQVINGLREEVKNKDRIIEKNSQVVRELRQRIMQLDEIFAKALQEMPKRQEQQQFRGKVLKISNTVLLILNYWILARTSCLFDSELVVK